MIIDKMDYIFAIAEEQNLTRAAERLFVAQSTLTMYLNRLENSLGIKLFDRSKSPILPTAAGQLYIDELKKVQKIEKKLMLKLNQLAQPEKTINVGIGPMRSLSWMPKVLPLFRELYPEVEVRLLEQGDEVLSPKLHAGDLDVMIGTMSANPEDVVVELAYETVMLLVPRSYGIVSPQRSEGDPLRQIHEILPEQLGDFPLIMPDPMNDLHTFTAQILDHFMIRPKSVITATSMGTAALLAAEGLGYVITTPAFFQLFADQIRDSVVCCSVKDMPGRRKLIAAYRPDSIKKDMIRRFIELLREEVLCDQNGLELLPLL